MPKKPVARISLLLCFILILNACASSRSDPTPTAAPTTRPTIMPTVPPTPTFDSSIVIPTPVPTVAPTAVPETNGVDEGGVEGGDSAEKTIIVGSRDFTEQFVLAYITIHLLEEAGFNVVNSTGLGGTQTAHAALRADEIDIYWEYTGTALSEFHNIPPLGLPTNPVVAWETVSALDQIHNELTWLAPGEFNDTYTLMIREGTISEDLGSIEDLADFMNDNESPLTVCVENDFFARGDGLFPLMDHYGFSFKEENIQLVSYDSLYEELRAGNCDVAEGFSTDGRIGAWGFQNLVDSREFFPAYNAAPIVRNAILEQYPEIATLLNEVGSYLDNQMMTALNARVDLGADGVRNSGDEETLQEVAQSFLEEVGLAGDKPTLVIGTQPSTEMQLLNKLAALLLRANGFNVAEVGLESETYARDALLVDKVDLTFENSIRSLMEFHNIPPTALPRELDVSFDMVASLDSQHNELVWLQPAGFASQLAGLVSPGPLAGEIGSIDDLAVYLQNENPNLSVCVDEWAAAVAVPQGEQYYNIIFNPETLTVSDPDTLFQNLREGVCELAFGRNIDGRVSAWGLERLPDNLGIFPATNFAPVVRQGVLNQYPQINDILGSLSSLIDVDTISLLSARVEVGGDGILASGDEQSVEAVARDFLEGLGFIGDRPQIVVGSRDFTEQFVLAYLSILMLEDAGFFVIDKTGLGGTNTGYDAISNGDIDVLWEYTGTALSEFHDVNPLPTDPNIAWQTVAELDQPNGLTWLDPGLFNDTYTFMINPAFLNVEAELTSIDDLAAYMNENDSPLTVCVENDFFSRGDGLYPLMDHYGFTFKDENIQLVSYDSLYDSLRAGDCDVAEGFSTDGRISAWGFQNLEDSQLFFPAYNAGPIVRQTVLDENPLVTDTLNRLGPFLTNEAITLLNAQVDLGPDGERNTGDERSAKSVARLFLCENEMIAGCAPSSTTIEEAMAAAETAENEAVEVDSAETNTSSNCFDLLINGDFESSDEWRIPRTSATAEYATSQVHQGNWAMELRSANRGNIPSFSAINQRVLVPEDASSVTVDFWYYPISLDLVGGDEMGLYVYDDTLTVLQQRFLLGVSNEQAWVQRSFDLTNFVGEEIMLHIVVINDGDGVPTNVFIDDIAMRACYDE